MGGGSGLGSPRRCKYFQYSRQTVQAAQWRAGWLSPHCSGGLGGEVGTAPWRWRILQGPIACRYWRLRGCTRLWRAGGSARRQAGGPAVHNTPIWAAAIGGSSSTGPRNAVLTRGATRSLSGWCGSKRQGYGGPVAGCHWRGATGGLQQRQVPRRRGEGGAVRGTSRCHICALCVTQKDGGALGSRNNLEEGALFDV